MRETPPARCGPPGCDWGLLRFLSPCGEPRPQARIRPGLPLGREEGSRPRFEERGLSPGEYDQSRTRWAVHFARRKCVGLNIPPTRRLRIEQRGLRTERADV